MARGRRRARWTSAWQAAGPIVTGGSKGLGKAIAAELLAEGAAVAICSRDDAELEATAAELAASCGRHRSSASAAAT